MSESVITAVQAAIVPGDETAPSPLQQSLGAVTGSDGNSLSHQVSDGNSLSHRVSHPFLGLFPFQLDQVAQGNCLLFSLVLLKSREDSP